MVDLLSVDSSGTLGGGVSGGVRCWCKACGQHRENQAADEAVRDAFPRAS